MRSVRIRVARRVTGVMVLMALTGILATCGGPMAFAREEHSGGTALEARGLKFTLHADTCVANPHAGTIRVPVRVMGWRPDSAVVGVAITDDEGSRSGQLLGRSVRRHEFESEPDMFGRFWTVVHVPVDLAALQIPDGQAHKVRVDVSVETPRGDGNALRAERSALTAQATIAVSSLPVPSGDWYPGDAHFHSTVSDGALSLGETLTEAKNVYGMKWLVISDHWKSTGAMGGVAYYPSTDGAPAGFPSYYDTVLEHGAQLGLPVGPACEWSSAKNAIPGSGSHVLGMAMSRAANWTFPAMFSESRQTLVNRLNAHNADAFTVAAHPVGTQVNGMYAWDWKVTGNDGVELFTDMNSFHETIRTNWFARLRSELPTVIANGPSGNFTVGIATSDGHANGWTTVAGGSSMTWLRMPGGERTLPSPDNVKAVWKRMRAGNCIASGQGDFAVPTLTATAGGATATAGPGDLVRLAKGSSAKIATTYASRKGHRLKSVDVWRCDAASVTRLKSTPVDKESGTAMLPSDSPIQDCFYVAVAHFYDPAQLNTALRDVVGNPVWVKVVP